MGGVVVSLQEESLIAVEQVPCQVLEQAGQLWKMDLENLKFQWVECCGVG